VVTLVIPALSFAGVITASARPSNDMVVKGQELQVPVVIDISELPEVLGSYTASLTWNPNVLKYISHSPGVAEGFTSPVVNPAETSEGELLFAAANPYGTDGEVNILNVVFEVIGAEGADCALALSITAIYAAKTFNDLMPYVELVTGVEGGLRVAEIPKQFALLQNHPNPFNPFTEIGYQLPKIVRVKIQVFNTSGQLVKILVDGQVQAGTHKIRWDARNDDGTIVPSGMYFVVMNAEKFRAERKVLLVR